MSYSLKHFITAHKTQIHTCYEYADIYDPLYTKAKVKSGTLYTIEFWFYKFSLTFSFTWWSETE